MSAALSPEVWLGRALNAKSAALRARCAERGLAARAALDRETQALLLRQLHLAYMDCADFARAEACALQAAELGALPDVLLQDAARAAAGRGAMDAAIVHLKRAARTAPIARRAFHWWTLGATLLLAQRYAESARYLQRAADLAGDRGTLYRAHWALARIAGGHVVADVQAIASALANSHEHGGYSQFVLGHLAYAAREWIVAAQQLTTFLQRTARAPAAARAGLRGEIAMAGATLAKIREGQT